MTHVTRFLREHAPNGLEELEKQFFIHISRHKQQEGLVLLKYDQLNSPMSNPIVQECRGIILDESQDWEVLVFPYSKFFNMREVANAAVIDWTQPVRAYEKIDGSLMTMYWHQGAWRVATSGVPDASGKLHNPNRPVNPILEGDEETAEDTSEKSEEKNEPTIRPTEVDPETGLTPVGSGPGRKSFAELFWEVFKLLGYEEPREEDRNRCYMFELATPQNRVLIRHTKAQLYLHGVRNMSTLQEDKPDGFCEKYGWKLTPMVELKSKAEFESVILPKVNSLDGLQCEGYVICDAQFNRFKLKCPSYVNLSLLYNKDGNEWKRLVGIVQVNEGSEFLAYFPHCTDLYNSILARYERIIATLRAVAKKYQHLNPKDLSATMKSLPDWIRGPLFIHLKTKEDFKAWFGNPQRYNQLCTMLNPKSTGPEFPDLDKLPEASQATASSSASDAQNALGTSTSS